MIHPTLLCAPSGFGHLKQPTLGNRGDCLIRPGKENFNSEDHKFRTTPQFWLHPFGLTDLPKEKLLICAILLSYEWILTFKD